MKPAMRGGQQQEAVTGLNAAVEANLAGGDGSGRSSIARGGGRRRCNRDGRRHRTCRHRSREVVGVPFLPEEGPKQGKEGDGDDVEARCGRAGRLVLDEEEDAGRWRQVDAAGVRQRRRLAPSLRMSTTCSRGRPRTWPPQRGGTPPRSWTPLALLPGRSTLWLSARRICPLGIAWRASSGSSPWSTPPRRCAWVDRSSCCAATSGST